MERSIAFIRYIELLSGKSGVSKGKFQQYYSIGF